MQCNLCDGNQFDLLFYGNLQPDDLQRFSQYARYGDILKCRQCGFVMQKFEHDHETILQYLKSEKYLDEEIGSLNLQEKHYQFDVLIRYMNAICPIRGKTLLDAGANTGIFLNLIQPIVDSVQGIEPSKEAATSARQMFGLDVQEAVISEADVQDNHFDIITMWDVIEHLYNPRHDLEFLFGKLKPGGFVFISTHDIEDVYARLTGSDYPFLMYQHFCHFSKRTLRMMLEKNGYRVLGAKSFRKSFSLFYLYHVLGKIWPDSSLVQIVRWFIGMVNRIPGVGNLRIMFPTASFFVMAAERPVLPDHKNSA